MKSFLNSDISVSLSYSHADWKPLINDRLRVSKISWKIRIRTIYNFAVIYLWNLLFLKKVAYFLTVSIVFSFIKETLWFNNFKTRRAMNVPISVFAICVEATKYWLLYNLHDCTFNVFMSMRSFQCFFCLLWTDYTTCSRVFIVDFEQVNTHWVCSDFCVCVHLFC